ncbi:hypothetical protein PENSPDRAFT_347231 [Peniophora sp. CONT]|nr:hypothetical protein PENSPDRAFT_347231 [Peniophora sp. CONT]
MLFTQQQYFSLAAAASEGPRTLKFIVRRRQQPAVAPPVSVAIPSETCICLRSLDVDPYMCSRLLHARRTPAPHRLQIPEPIENQLEKIISLWALVEPCFLHACSPTTVPPVLQLQVVQRSRLKPVHHLVAGDRGGSPCIAQRALDDWSFGLLSASISSPPAFLQGHLRALSGRATKQEVCVINFVPINVTQRELWPCCGPQTLARMKRRGVPCCDETRLR